MASRVLPTSAFFASTPSKTQNSHCLVVVVSPLVVAKYGLVVIVRNHCSIFPACISLRRFLL